MFFFSLSNVIVTSLIIRSINHNDWEPNGPFEQNVERKREKTNEQIFVC